MMVSGAEEGALYERSCRQKRDAQVVLVLQLPGRVDSHKQVKKERQPEPDEHQTEVKLLMSCG